MKKLLIAFVLVNAAQAEEVIYPTLPGGYGRDYSGQAYVIDRGVIQPTIQGTNVPDLTESGYRFRGNELQPTLPGGFGKDYAAPSYRIERD